MFRTRFADHKNDQNPLEISDKILRGAQSSGVLMLTNRGLSRVPSIVWKLNTPLPPEEKVINFESSGDGARWWETQPLQRLNLSGNAISELSGQGLVQINTLVSFDMRDNELAGLPDEISELADLKQIFLNCNKLTCLPQKFIQLQSLVLLEVSHNLLGELPPDLQCLSALEKMDVSFNKLTQLPPRLPPKLVFLNVNNNQLANINRGLLQSCSKLREFDASQNHLMDIGIDQSGTQMENVLTILHLHNNQLADLPVLEVFPRLKEVTLGNNKVDKISPEKLQGLLDLATLDLRSNKIASVPSTLPSMLPALARFDVSNNELTSVPTEFGFMESLNVLSLSGNPLRTIGQSVLSSGTQALKALLRDRQESNLPDESLKSAGQNPTQSVSAETSPDTIDLPAVSSASILDWSGAARPVSRFAAPVIKSLSDEIPLDDVRVWSAVAFRGTGSNAVVRDVKLCSRLLESFPMGLMNFQETMVSLNLSQNRLTQLPEEILHLSKLTELNVRRHQFLCMVKQHNGDLIPKVSKNSLQSLPTALTSMNSLQTLVLDFNAPLGPELPVAILFAPPLSLRLRNLSARGCRLAGLPSAGEYLTPEKMPVLQNLDVSENDISKLDPELGLCHQIQNLQLSGNTFRVPRPAIVAKGTAAIMEYLRSRIPIES